MTTQSLETYRKALLRSRDTAELELLAAKSRIEEMISVTVVSSAEKEIARAAQSVARYTAVKSWLQWLGGSALVGMLAIAGGFYWGFSLGKTTGYASAVEVTLASGWAATKAGKAAYTLNQNGDLTHIIRCENPGWKVVESSAGERECFVYPTKDGSVTGWVLP